jgi:diguanylate cyclase (GGDEF)-like protein
MIYGTLVAQGIGAMVLAILLHSFYRHYGKTYLHRWGWSWWMLAVFALASVGARRMALDGGSTMPAAVGLSIVRGVAGYLHVGLMALGGWELAQRRPVRLRATRRFLWALAIAGVLLTLMFAFDPAAGGKRYFLRVSVLALVGAILLIGTGIAVLRKRESDRGLGFAVVGVGLILYGTQQGHYLLIALTGFGREYASYLAYLDFVLQSLLGLGMITCLLEDERQAAILASNEIEHLAYHDALTGLPNRPLFIDRLIVAVAHCARRHQALAVFFLDVDRFKDINDTLGHSHGDALLKALALRIRHCVRDEDTVARFGGDEFTLLCQRVESAEDAAKIAQKLLQAVKQPFSIGDHELYVSVSIGISFYPADGVDAESLVKNADTAMYRAKDHGRDNYQIYAPAMNARAMERLARENRLRRALDNGEMELYYQPLIDLPSRRVCGAEALLRWRHPEEGILTPYHFIGSLESSGLIIPVGDWVLREACHQATEWKARHGVDLSVAVNLSERQFQQPDLVDRVRAALEETGLPAGQLELEITENNTMQNAENSIRTLWELKRLGVRIAVDDFGTGYSSLSYLKRFPIDTLKLDQSFVRDVTDDPGDAAIATAVISMAKTLNLTLVAEGVETEGQLAFFLQRQCPRLQGYLFSRPLPASEFDIFVSHGMPLPAFLNTGAS